MIMKKKFFFVFITNTVFIIKNYFLFLFSTHFNSHNNNISKLIKINFFFNYLSNSIHSDSEANNLSDLLSNLLQLEELDLNLR